MQKRKTFAHPALNLGKIISSKSGHEHLEFIQVSKVNIKSYSGEATLKSKRGNALLKYLSNDVKREVFNQV